MLETKAFFQSYYFQYHNLQNQKLALAYSKDVCLKNVGNARKSKKILTCIYRCYRHAHPHIVWVSELMKTFPQTKKKPTPSTSFFLCQVPIGEVFFHHSNMSQTDTSPAMRPPLDVLFQPKGSFMAQGLTQIQETITQIRQNIFC